MVLRFHQGTNLAAASKWLSDCVRRGQDVAAGAAGQDEHRYLNTYLSWVELTEGHLRNVFSDLEVVHHLRTTAYWAIRDALFQPFRVARLIIVEVGEQTRWLTALSERLGTLESRLQAAPGVATVVDTNVLLQYQPPWSVDWPRVVGREEVRLVLPLRVIEELDERKYMSRDAELADRARRLLSRLWRDLGGSAGGPVPLRENVTMEVPVEDDRRVRLFDADQEILDSCEQLRNVGRPPIVITGDTGMSLRARALQLDVVRMPDKYLRKAPARGPQEPGGDEES